ncbi:MAG TPA: site-specific integrase [Gemmatimonadales bacterium]|nr:site-specific integrase [Gemmatimonadales bacterium]
MSIYRRKDSESFYLDVRWHGCPRIRLSAHTTNKTRAKAFLSTLRALRNAGRRDILGLLATGRLDLHEVHELFLRDPEALEQRLTRAQSPSLGPLVDQWLSWLNSPAALSRRREPFATRTVYRYGESWNRIFAHLPRGREAPLSDLSRAFLADYSQHRRRAGTAGATVNRDLVALSSFLSWCECEAGIAVVRPKMTRERESAGRERWLSSSELTCLLDAMPPNWRPLFSTLAYTGLRIGEAQSLLKQDVRLSERRIVLGGGIDARLKTRGSARVVPLPGALAPILAEQAVRYDAGPVQQFFPPELRDYAAARRVFRRAAKVAGLAGVVIHDLRHTFAVHSARAGVPLARLQKLLGHTSPVMTMRYLKHAPESYLDQDAERAAASISGSLELESAARAELSRMNLKVISG